jgi:hypothetical protein
MNAWVRWRNVWLCWALSNRTPGDAIRNFSPRQALRNHAAQVANHYFISGKIVR